MFAMKPYVRNQPVEFTVKSSCSLKEAEKWYFVYLYDLRNFPCSFNKLLMQPDGYRLVHSDTLPASRPELTLIWSCCLIVKRSDGEK